MQRFLSTLIITIAFVANAVAQKTYFTIHMNGNRVGYSYSEASPTTDFGAATFTESYSSMDLGLLGTPVSLKMVTKTWEDSQSNPKRMEMTVESGGRTQTATCTFLTNTIEMEANNNGTITKKSIPLPKDAPVVDDPINAFYRTSRTKFYVFDPMILSLVKNEVKVGGNTTVNIRGQVFSAKKIVIDDSRTTTSLFLSAKGDVIKVEGAMGLEMYPATEEEALKPIEPAKEGTDLAFNTAITLNGEIPALNTIKRLRLEINGPENLKLPNGGHQSVKQNGSTYTVEIHPLTLNKETTIAQAAAFKPEWTKPSLNISSEDAAIIAESKKAVRDAKTVAEAALNTCSYVFGIMTPNAGIGVLRDSKEVLETKEGVCRDYAILTAALLRAAKVPTQLVSGLVLDAGKYYYHAWVEVWDGKNWIGVDSTRNNLVGPGYIKLGEGQVEEAFKYSVLERATIKVLSVTKR